MIPAKTARWRSVMISGVFVVVNYSTRKTRLPSRVNQAHLGFSCYLTGQVVQVEAVDLIDSIASNIGWTYRGKAAPPQNWDDLR